MKWRALLQNQWFQLCLLVAMLSGAATIYNAVKSTPPSGTASRPSPSSTPPPLPPIHKIRPKKTGQWILDASGARDSDSKDIQVVAASLTDGDLVTVRPGTYTGNCEIAVNARFVGPAPDKGVASIRSVDPKRVGMSISGKKVSLENLSLNREAVDDAPAVRISSDSQVEMTACATSTKSRFAVLVTENASFTAQASQFSAVGVSVCLKYEGNAHGSVSRCTFSGGEWGLEGLTTGQIEASNCTFEKIGSPDGQGSIVAVVGGRASAKLDTCQFTDNTVAVYASEGASLTLIGSTFRNNGVNDGAANKSTGLVCVKNKAKAVLQNDTFDNNKQGLIAVKAGSLTLTHVMMNHTGLIVQNAALRPFCQSIAANDQDTIVVATDCTIDDSRAWGIAVGGGAHFKMEGGSVGQALNSWLYLGRDGRATAEFDHVQFTAAGNTGLYVCAGSSLTLRHCQISDVANAGLLVRDRGTEALISDTTIKDCKGVGIFAQLEGTISAGGCTIEENARGIQAGNSEDDPAKSAAIALTDCTVRGNSIFGLGTWQRGTIKMRGGFLGNNTKDSEESSGGEIHVD
jgi:hypothetical protein